MKRKRRDFLKTAGIAGLSIAGGSVMKSHAGEPLNMSDPELSKAIRNYEEMHIQQYNMSGYAAPKIGNVRIGIIGLGQRGPSHLKTLINIEIWLNQPLNKN